MNIQRNATALLTTLILTSATGAAAQPADPWGAYEQKQPTISEPELAYPGRQGEKVETILVMPDGTQEVVEVELIDGEVVYQGDIILNVDAHGQVRLVPEQLHGRGAGRDDVEYFWPGNVVYYEIDSGLSNTSRVTNAIDHWEDETFLTFVESSSAPDRILFKTGTGCSSSIGRQGGVQNIKLKSTCSTGNTIHEIGHAVGLFHEHTRGDRDSYVTINWSNIKSGKSGNFNQYSNGQDLGTYDPDSVMHYSCTGFSKNGQNTIDPNDSSWCNRMGQRDGLSENDISGINGLYPPWHYDLFGSLESDLAAELQETMLLPPMLLGARAIVGADVDGDGTDELAVLSLGMQLYIVDAENPYLITAMDPISFQGGTDLAAVDTDGDGTDEIAVVKSGGIYVYNAPSGSPFSTLVDVWNLPVPATEIAGVDTDGDGVDELAVRFGFNLYLFSEETLLGFNPTLLFPLPDLTIASVDHDGDGVDEIAVASSLLRAVYLWESADIAQPFPGTLVARDAYSVAAGDLEVLAGVDTDGDGVDEIATIKF